MVRAFSSFNDEELIKILIHIKENDDKERIRKESERSLKIISNQLKN